MQAELKESDSSVEYIQTLPVTNAPVPVVERGRSVSQFAEEYNSSNHSRSKRSHDGINNEQKMSPKLQRIDNLDIGAAGMNNLCLLVLCLIYEV